MAETEPPVDGAGKPDPAQSSPAAEPEPMPVPAPARRRDQNFRLQLVKKLPRLGRASWSVRENFRLDEEWGTVVDLRADAILGVLERVAPERLR